jgi:hypothetical protein
MRRLVCLSCVAALCAPPYGGRCQAAHALRAEQSFDEAAFDADCQRRQTRLRSALAALDASLAANSAEVRDGWREFLGWDGWAQPLLASGTWRPDEMRRCSKRFYAAQEGLEHPLVVNLREALNEYLECDEAIRAARGDMNGEYHRRLAQLRKASSADSSPFAELEAAAWWLSATGQAPEALAEVRLRFSGPAIIGQIHRDIVEAKLGAFESTAEERRSTRKQINGATVVGVANVQSHAAAELFDAPSDIRLRVLARGDVDAPHNVATSGRVRIATSSRATFTALADVYWDGRQFTSTDPQVTADLRSTIRGIDAPRLLRRAAARRAYGGRASAEAEAESLVERDVAASMSERLATVVAKLNHKSEGFLNFLARTGTTAVRWETRLRPTSVQIGYLPPSPTGLSAEPHEPPPLEGDETIGLSFHDSALEGLLRPQLAGAEWKDVNFSMLQRELTGGNSEEFMIGLDPQRWSVAWSWRTPVRIHFRADCAVVRFRFSRVEIDGAAYDRPFEVRAELEASATPEGHELRTRGAARVESLDAENPLPPHFQAFLERKFRSMFSPRFYLDGLQFPAGGALDGMSSYRAVGARLEPHWIHLRYSNRKPSMSLAAR